MTADSSQAAQDDTGSSRLMGSTNDLADDTPRSRLDQVLQWVPRILSSKPHVIALVALGVYLIVLPLLGVMVSAKSELIGGNYTNVTSDIAASIAAGGTLHLVNQGRKRRQMDEIRSGGSYLSQNDLRLHFGLGDATRIDRVTVKWPSGTVDTVSNIPADRHIVMEEGSKTWRKPPR